MTKRKENGWVRMTVDLTPELNLRLETLRSRVGASSKADVMREALKLYERLAELQQDRKGRLLLESEGGTMVELVLI